MTKHTLPAALCGIALLLTGCGTSDTPTDAPETPVAATSSPVTPSPTPEATTTSATPTTAPEPTTASPEQTPAAADPLAGVDVQISDAAITAVGSEDKAREAARAAATAMLELNSISTYCGHETWTIPRQVSDFPELEAWFTPSLTALVNEDVFAGWTEEGNVDALSKIWQLLFIDADTDEVHCTGVTPAELASPVVVNSTDGSTVDVALITNQDLLSDRISDGRALRGPAERTVTLTMTPAPDSAHGWLIDTWRGKFAFGATEEA